MAGSHLSDVPEISARLAIQELSARYALGMDSGDREFFASVWTKDAIFRCEELGLDCQGIEAILEYYDRGPGRSPAAPTPGSSVRLSGNLVVTIDGDQATGVSEFIALRRSELSYYPYTFGIYRDSYRKTSAGWQISVREMIVAPVRNSV